MGKYGILVAFVSLSAPEDWAGSALPKDELLSTEFSISNAANFFLIKIKFLALMTRARLENEYWSTKAAGAFQG